MSHTTTTPDPDLARELRFWRFATIAVLLLGIGVITVGAGNVAVRTDDASITRGDIVIWRYDGDTYIAAPEGTIIAKQSRSGFIRMVEFK